MAGSIEIVGLDAVNSALGETWSQMAERVQAIAQDEIRKHLGRTDSCQPQGDTRFVISFASLDHAAAETATMQDSV